MLVDEWEICKGVSEVIWEGVGKVRAAWIKELFKDDKYLSGKCESEYECQVKK